MIHVFLPVCLVMLALATAARAETLIFDIALRGLNAGTITLEASESGGSYAVEGQMESRGIVGALAPARFEARSRGSWRKGRYVPAQYEESFSTAKRSGRATMDYEGGVPGEKRHDPPQDRDVDAPETIVDPATQGGTLDPLTGLFAALRSVVPGEECKLDLAIFDGARLSRITTTGRREAEGRIQCTGTYRRVAGYSARDMARETAFPFILTYGTDGPRLRVTEITIETLLGRATLKRR